jgi:tRNA modification GTPase
VTVAICGKPNTGKSSLLNCLLGYDKAIVSDVAGTTRDAVEGTVEIDGVKFNLYDTAGVHESGDKIESIGIDKAESIVKSADVCVLVVDPTMDSDKEDERIERLVQGRPTIKVVNKTDVLKDYQKIPADVHTSAVTGDGVDKLKALLYEKSMGQRGEDVAFLVEERHYDALKRAEEYLQKAIRSCDASTLDLIGLDVTDAWSALGEITGETASERIIEEIFSKFCVGK